MGFAGCPLLGSGRGARIKPQTAIMFNSPIDGQVPPSSLKALPGEAWGGDQAPPSQLHFTVKRDQTGQSPALVPGFLKLARGGVSSMN